ncbi:MAG: hypothetical protein E7425_12695 [Ruminococcaceae bacterium]|nr:hypothetical protein [Oscillospiraceae bacterium]
MELDTNGLRVNRTGCYTKADAVSSKAEAKEAENVDSGAQETEAATFEADGGRDYNSGTVRSGYTIDTETVERLKAESEQRMMNLVRQMLGQQVEQADLASAITKDNVLEAIKSGKFTQEDIEQAQKDTAEDGYWGVEQTSDRFIQYATALTGGDPDKLDAMIEAFEKGYAEAEKQWGGELPELSQRTREATLKKFQDLKDQYANGSASSAAAQGVLETSVQKAMSE